MSKVISFSISDRYLDKLRSLYPSLTDNLAAKQFLTDRLNSSLGNSLDDGLDDGLDGKLKSLIESELDGILEGRLDATVGKLVSDLSERMARLEERLDDSLDGRLDDMEPSPFPTIGENVEATIETVEAVDKVESVYTVETVYDTVESVYDTVESVYDTVESVYDTVEAVYDTVEAVTDTVESVDKFESVDEPDKGAIGPVPGDSISINKPCNGMTAMAAVDYLETKKVTVSYASLHRWIGREKIPDTSPQGKDALKHLILRNKLYYPIN